MLRPPVMVTVRKGGDGLGAEFIVDPDVRGRGLESGGTLVGGGFPRPSTGPHLLVPSRPGCTSMFGVRSGPSLHRAAGHDSRLPHPGRAGRVPGEPSRVLSGVRGVAFGGCGGGWSAHR